MITFKLSLAARPYTFLIQFGRTGHPGFCLGQSGWTLSFHQSRGWLRRVDA